MASAEETALLFIMDDEEGECLAILKEFYKGELQGLREACNRLVSLIDYTLEQKHELRNLDTPER